MLPRYIHEQAAPFPAAAVKIQDSFDQLNPHNVAQCARESDESFHTFNPKPGVQRLVAWMELQLLLTMVKTDNVTSQELKPCSKQQAPALGSRL